MRGQNEQKVERRGKNGSLSSFGRDEEYCVYGISDWLRDRHDGERFCGIWKKKEISPQLFLSLSLSSSECLRPPAFFYSFKSV